MTDYMNNKKRIFAAVLFGIVLFTGILTCTKLAYASSEAEAESGAVKCYKSVMIYLGDTLESVAEEYQPEEYTTLNEYINEIRKINHLRTDTALIPGNYIIIPCYCTVSENENVIVNGQ